MNTRLVVLIAALALPAAATAQAASTPQASLRPFRSDRQLVRFLQRCVDWYGNSRPIFLDGRILALLGYEIVEGAVVDGRIREVRRAAFAPRALVATTR